MDKWKFQNLHMIFLVKRKILNTKNCLTDSWELSVSFAKILYDLDFDIKHWKILSWKWTNMTLPWGKWLLWAQQVMFGDISDNLYQVVLKKQLWKGKEFKEFCSKNSLFMSSLSCVPVTAELVCGGGVVVVALHFV